MPRDCRAHGTRSHVRRHKAWSSCWLAPASTSLYGMPSDASREIYKGLIDMALLKSWYKVVTPREDLRESKPLDASEFAVHLDQVRDGRAPAVYRNPNGSHLSDPIAPGTRWPSRPPAVR